MDLPDEPRLRWIISQAAALLERGAKPASGLVLPTPEFFPDRFDGTQRAIAALLERIVEHAGLAGTNVAPRRVAPGGEAPATSCGSGGCCGDATAGAALERVVRGDDGSYEVAIDLGEVRNPIVLTTTLARSAAWIFLTEADARAAAPDDPEALADLTAVLLGFGVLLANGSYIYRKGCGGVQVGSATAMTVDELAVALAIFCRLHDMLPRAARKHLDPTPAAYFDKANDWAASNAAVLKALATDPASLRGGDFAMQPARGWLGRLFGGGGTARVR